MGKKINFDLPVFPTKIFHYMASVQYDNFDWIPWMDHIPKYHYTDNCTVVMQ